LGFLGLEAAELVALAVTSATAEFAACCMESLQLQNYVRTAIGPKQPLEFFRRKPED